MSSGDQGKLLIFSLLMALSIVMVGVGLIPTIFLVFGVYMMKKNQDFSSIDTAVKNCKWFFWLLFIGFTIYSVNCYLGMEVEKYGYRSGEGAFHGSLVFTGIAFVYLVAVQVLFYSPLKNHSEWVAANGIFSTKLKSVNDAESKSEMDIIKGEKLKQYSVADELIKWAKLKDDGHISEEEFNEARQKLLKR